MFRPFPLLEQLKGYGLILEFDLDYFREKKNEFGVLPSGETIAEVRNILLIDRVAKKLKAHDKDT